MIKGRIKIMILLFVITLITANAVRAENDTGITEDEIPEFVSWENSGMTDHVIAFNDEGMSLKIRSILGKETGDIMLSDLWEMTDLGSYSY